MQYSDWVNAVAAEFEFLVADPTLAAPFIPSPTTGQVTENGWLPIARDYAEQRIYRELDLLGTRVEDNSANLTAGTRKFFLPTSMGTFVVVEQVAVIDNDGILHELLPASRPFIDTVYPHAFVPAVPTLPVKWCPFDQSSILVGPASDADYSMSIIGTIRPTPLSSTNTSTILTTYLPDLFVAASFISWAGYQRDYGAMSDDKALAQSWENQYQSLKSSAAVEQFRAKFMSEGWSCYAPNPVATPRRS